LKLLVFFVSPQDLDHHCFKS